MSTRGKNELERIRSEIETAIATALRDNKEARAVIVVPIIIEIENPKPRMPYRAWVIQQYRDAGQ